VWSVARDTLTCDIPRLSGSMIGDQEDGRSHYITGIPLIGRLAVCLSIARLYVRHQGLLFTGAFPGPLRRDRD
jgi:hypothetical protein